MGCDISAHIIVGAPFEDVCEEVVEKIEVVKTDKNGVSYTVEEEHEVTIIVGKKYKEACPVLILNQEYGLDVFNGEIVGISIYDTPSNRRNEGPLVEIEKGELEKRVSEAFDILQKAGIPGKVYLFNEIS